MERKNQNLDLDYRGLLDRQLFSGEKLSDYILRISSQKAIQKLDEINNLIKTTPKTVIDSCKTKLITWGIGDGRLDHIKSWVI